MSSPVSGRDPGKPRVPVFHILLGLLYTLSLLAVAFLLASGGSFYATPLSERAHHPGYWTWKAGGSAGQLLGVVGASMMTVLLLYSVRKRVRLFRRLGALSRWLDLHIYLGVVGPLLIVLHTGFKVGGLVALSFWSMVAVALSGVVGRFLYLQIPRTRAGEELSLTEVRTLDDSLSERLRRDFRLSEAALLRLNGLSAPPEAERRGLRRGLFGLLFGNRELRRDLRAFAQECRTVPKGVFQEFERIALQKALLHRRILLWDRLHELFHYWHVFHKPFAVVMYLFMIVHIAVAVMTGYGWAGRG